MEIWLGVNCIDFVRVAVLHVKKNPLKNDVIRSDVIRSDVIRQYLELSRLLFYCSRYFPSLLTKQKNIAIALAIT